MPETRRLGLADLILLLVVVALAAASRVGYLVWLADSGRSGGPFVVQQSSMAGWEPAPETAGLVESVRKDWTFASRAPFSQDIEPTAHVSPGYAYLVGGVSWVFRGERADLAMRWLQAGLGVLTAAFCYLILFYSFPGRAPALLGGILAAWHPFWIVAESSLEDGAASTFLLAVALLLGLLASRSRSALTSLLLGLTLAALALMRAPLLPFSFLMVGWFLLRMRTQPQGWLCSLLVVLGFIIGLSPWTVRCYQLLGEPVPVVDSTYLHLWIGNNPQATGGPAGPQAWKEGPGGELTPIANQASRYAQLGPRVIEEIREHPTQTVQRRMRAALYFLVGADWLQDGRLAPNPGEVSRRMSSPPEAAEGSQPAEVSGRVQEGMELSLHLTLFALLILAALGWRWSYAWPGARLPLALALIWVPFPYVMSHAEARSGPRLPFDVVLICYAAVGLAYLLPSRLSKLREKSLIEPTEEPA